MTAGSISKPRPLRFYDPIFHVAALDVVVIVERLRYAFQVGLDEAWWDPRVIITTRRCRSQEFAA